MSFLTRLAVLAVVLPFAAATNCGSNQFLYRNKNICVTLGSSGSSDATTAPSGVTCPTSKGSWFWSKSNKCCLPSSDNHDDDATCPGGYQFNKDGSACVKTPSTPSTPNNCQSNEFWWSSKSCCLPNGGPSSPPPPPSGTKCPSNWSWHSGKGCCTPHTPPTGTPTCPGGWDWCSSIYQCQPHPGPPPSQPSGHPRRALKSRSNPLCPAGQEACQIRGAKGLMADYECLDTTSEPESCGGCASSGKGTDCKVAIKNSFSVGCEKSVCVLQKCKVGFTKSTDGKSCVAALKVDAARRDF